MPMLLAGTQQWAVGSLLVLDGDSAAAEVITVAFVDDRLYVAGCTPTPGGFAPGPGTLSMCPGWDGHGRNNLP